MHDDDFLDGMFEYDMVMNDGEWFFGKDEEDDPGHQTKDEASGCLGVLLFFAIPALLKFLDAIWLHLS